MLRRRPRSTRTCTRCPYNCLFRFAVQPNDRRDRRVLVAVRAEGNRARPGIQSTLGPVEIGVADVGIESPTFLLGLSRPEEHTSELQSLLRISYAVCCLKTIPTIYVRITFSLLYITITSSTLL